MPVLFFDFDDTLSEQIPFNLQYVRGLGRALAPQYGGDVEAWASHAADMMAALENDYVNRFRNDPLAGYCKWLPAMLATAVTLLFDSAGLPLPADPEEEARRMRRKALHECCATFPGAQQMLQRLHGRHAPIHMASGNDSEHLRYAMKGAGLLDYFDRLYGPDLVDCAKEGPEFYERILAHMHLKPQDALFIDNDPAAIGWAQSVGAQAIQVKLLPYHHVETAPGIVAVVNNLSLLPEIIH